MSSNETSPLLPQDEDAPLNLPHEHPIFLRVTHSAWTFVGQKALTFGRVLFLAYSIATWITTLRRDIAEDDENAGLFVFQVDNISLTIQTLYYLVTSFWSIQHLRSPSNRPQRESQNLFARAGGRAMSFISIPRTTEWGSGKKFLFSTFYTMSVTFPFVVTFLHYVILGDNHGKHLKNGSEHDYIDISKHGINCFISFVEILFLSSIRQIKPFVGHCLTFGITPAVYFAWAQLSKPLAGEFPYNYVDPSQNDAKKMTFNVVASMSLSAAAFLLVQSLHTVRDIAARKADCDRST